MGAHLSNNERGFGLLVNAVCAVVMFGTLGLAVDLGLTFIVKNELQAYVDNAAMVAGRSLDGTAVGVQLAHAAALHGPLSTSQPNAYNFDTQVVSSITDTYATSYAGTYDSYATASSGLTNTYRFVKVAASAVQPLYFLPVIGGIGTVQSVQAAATAGQQANTAAFTSGGLVPFMPDAHNSSDTTNFGLTVDQVYTLKWGNGNTTTCPGDAGFSPGNAPSAHGFVDLGQGNGNSSLRGVIVYGGYPNSGSSPNHVSVGDTLSSVPGNRGASIFSSSAERSNQDSDQVSLTWAEYKLLGLGNGRRIVTAPIGNPALASGHGANTTIPVVGFGNFLLAPGITISGSSGPLCATYIGPASLNSPTTVGTDGTKVYTTLLYH